MIYFTGAGCGAADLITVRGQKLLQKADVVIYAGSLVNPELLKLTKENCKIYNSAYMTLEEVINVMIEAEKEGLNTVRLHTGDPCVYGATREQMDRLEKNNILYEICPGVSSFCGAAAALKAEYTLPDVSQTVILTRMEGRTAVPEKEKISLLAKHHATMVIFLSISLVESLQKELLLGGYKESTPCAIVYKATWEDEKVIKGILSNLAKMARENNITKMALITVGYFLGEDYELSKLYNKTFTTAYRKGTL